MARTKPNMWKRANGIENGHVRRFDGEQPQLRLAEVTCRSAENIPTDVEAVLRDEALRDHARQQERDRLHQSRKGSSSTDSSPSKENALVQVGGTLIRRGMKGGNARRQLRTWKIR